MINNVRDPVGVIPGAAGNLLNTKSLENAFLRTPDGIVFWGKYGRTMFFAENWNTTDYMKLASNPDDIIKAHGAGYYLDYMKKKLGTGSYKTWKEVRAAQRTGKRRDMGIPVAFIACPVDTTVSNSKGEKVATIKKGKTTYHTAIFPE